MMCLVTLVLTGVIYPLLVTGLSAVFFPGASAGSLIVRDGTVVGSSLIGQAFASPGYFHGRPSAAGEGYDAMASGGSNLGPTSAELASLVETRVAGVRETEDLAADALVPPDLATASASGLDPHISPDAAELQVPRVARERGLSEDAVRELVARNTEGRQLGMLGEARVNVLELNLDLDEVAPRPASAPATAAGG